MSTALPAVSRLANGNWGRIALDFARAIVVATGSAETVVMWTVLEESWFGPWFCKGPGEEAPTPIPVTLNIAELARQTARHPQNLRAARTKLIVSGLLIDTPSGLLPSKDYPSWIRPDTGYPMLDAAQLQHCLAALELPARFRKSSPKTGELKSSRAQKGSEQKHSLRIVGCEQKSSPADAQCEQKHSPEIQPPQTPLISSRASEDLIQTSIQKAATRDAASDVEEEQRRQSLLQSQSRLWDRGQHDLEQPGPNEPDPGRWDAWMLIADKLDLDPEIRAGFLSHRRQWPTEWLVLALKRVHHSGKRPGRFKYYLTILDDWAKAGRPDSGDWDFLDDNLKPMPFSARSCKPQGPGPKPAPRPPASKPDVSSFYNPNRPRPVPYGSAKPVVEASE